MKIEYIRDNDNKNIRDNNDNKNKYIRDNNDNKNIRDKR
jgi:hypothetical protein